jgi:hypothetical protein
MFQRRILGLVSYYLGSTPDKFPSKTIIYKKILMDKYQEEIYNHFDVRNKLSEFKFNSSGDTETVLYSYIKFGADCLALLNVIFSFAIFVFEIIMRSRNVMSSKRYF